VFCRKISLPPPGVGLLPLVCATGSIASSLREHARAFFDVPHFLPPSVYSLSIVFFRLSNPPSRGRQFAAQSPDPLPPSSADKDRPPSFFLVFCASSLLSVPPRFIGELSSSRSFLLPALRHDAVGAGCYCRPWGWWSLCTAPCSPLVP